MVELAPQAKIEEECPLLKVEGGSGDGSGQQLQSLINPLGWSVTCSSKRSWFDRWPEFLTACWMTGILLAITFLVMYVLTIGAVRKQSVQILKSNTSKPNSEVYYHHIVGRQNTATFTFFYDYLANMATKYRYLHFNVIFMIDDTYQNSGRGLRHTRLYARLTPLHPTRNVVSNFEYHNSVDIREFQLRYQNVNITIIPVSKFMARTQLRYKWTTIPLYYLTFYARIFSVWQTGGIGMDLPLFNNRYINNQAQDKRITTILKQHNDGINSDEYRRALDIIERNEESEFISVICGIVNQMIKETTNFFNNSSWFPQFIAQKEMNTNESLIRTHRNRRETTDNIINNTSINDTKEAIKFLTNVTANVNSTKNEFVQEMRNIEKLNEKANFTPPILLGRNIDELDYELAPNMYVSYISLIADDSGVLYMEHPKLENYVQPSNIAKLTNENMRYDTKPYKSAPYFLTLMSEGSFVASTSIMHPLLGHILSGGCRRMPPSVAIKDAFLSQCSGLSKIDYYCNNIFLI